MTEMKNTLYATIVFCLVWQAAARSLENDANESCVPKVCTDSNEHRFEVGRRYTYEYNVETSTELSGVEEGRSTTFSIKSKVVVKAITKCHLSVSFYSTQVSSDDFYAHQGHLDQLSSQLSANPTEVVWQDGEVEDVCMHITELTWVKNVKRGFVSAIQNTITDDQHTIVENDVSGDCKTTYHTEQSNSNIIVSKYKDLSKCTNGHTFVESAILFSDYDALSTRNTLLESSQQCTQTWSLENVLQSVKCDEKHLFRPFSYRGNGAQTTISQNIRLINTERRIPPQVLRPIELLKTTLTYEKENIILTSSSNLEKLSASLEEACNLMSQTTHYQSFPSAYIAIVKEMKAATREDLQNVWQSIQLGRVCELHSDDIKTVFLNALPMCISSNCVAMSVEILETNNIVKVDRLKEWLSAYAMIPQPTEKMISLLSPLLENSRPSNEVYLTLGTMVYRYCKSTSNCLTSATIVNLLQKFQNSFGTNCHTTNTLQIEKILLSLRAIGNAGITTATSIINSCAAEDRNKNDIRISAIQAIRRMDCRSDKSAVMSIFADSTEDSELRIAAYSAIMRCPNVNVISHVFRIMETEEVNQVGSYVWSHLMEVKTSSDPLKAYLSSLLSGQKFSEKFKKDKRKYSSYYEASLYSETLNVGGEFDGSMVWSTTSFIPRSVHANVTVDLFGSAVNLIEIGGRMEGVEGLIQDFLGDTAKDNEFLSSFLNPEKKRPKRSTEKEFKTAMEEIKSYYPHLHKNNDASGSAYLRMFGNEIAFHQLNSQQIETQSWIETANIAYKLFTGTDFNFQHQKVLMDSTLTVATGAGIPLSLLVTSATATDITMSGHLDFTSYLLKSNSPILMDTHLKPRAALDVSASMAVHLSSLFKAGVELDLKLSTGFDLDGHVSVEQGREVEIRFDVPEDTIELFNYKSKFFATNGLTKQELIAPSNDETYCTEQGADRFGMKICTSSSFHNVPMAASDPTPFLLAAAPQHIQVSIHKTDPGITHYLARGSYEFNIEEDNILPTAAALEFTVDTPGSYINRNFTTSIMFERTETESSLLVSGFGRSAHIHGSIKDEENLKEGLLQLTLDEEHVYSIKGHSSKTTLHDDKWIQILQIRTPTYTPTVQGNLTYAPGARIDLSFLLSDVLSEDVKIKANVEKWRNRNEHMRCNGEMSVYVPGYLDMSAELRSHSHGSRDTTKGTLTYGILGKAKQTAVYEYKYREYPVNSGTERWTTSSEFSTSQFPSLNHKIEAQYYKRPTSTESSFAVDYGQFYDYKSNQNKLIMRHYYRNFTTSAKTHYDSGMTIEAPSQKINYEVNLKHVYEWSDVINIESSFLLKKFDEKTVFIQLNAQDNSQMYVDMYGDVHVETPWGKAYSKHKIYQPDALTYTYLTSHGLGKLSEMQLQMKAELSMEQNNKYVLMHAYQPQISDSSSANILPPDVKIQELPPSSTIALFNASIAKTVYGEENFKTTGHLEVVSPWSEPTTASFESQRRSEQNRQGEKSTTISCSCSFIHPKKSLNISNDLSAAQQMMGDGSQKTSHAFEFRTDYFSTIWKQRYFTFQGESTQMKSLNDVRFESKLLLNHNDSQLFIPDMANASISTNIASSVSSITGKIMQNISMNAEMNIPGVLQQPISSSLNSNFEASSLSNVDYELSIDLQPALNNIKSVSAKSSNKLDQFGAVKHTTHFKVNNDPLVQFNLSAAKPRLFYNHIEANWLHDFRRLGFSAFKNVTLSAKEMSNEDEINAELIFTNDDGDSPSNVATSMEYSRLRKKLDMMFSHDCQCLKSLSVPPVLDLSARLSSNDQYNKLSLEITDGESDLLSTSSIITTPSPYTWNSEIRIKHGLNVIEEYGLKSPLVTKVDLRWDRNAPYEITSHTDMGERSLIYTGLLDIQKTPFDLQLKKLVYESSQMTEQVIVDLEVKDIHKPFYFKVDSGHKFLENSVNIDLASSTNNYENSASITLRHNYDALKGTYGLPINTKVVVTCSAMQLSSHGRNIRVLGDFDEKNMHLYFSYGGNLDEYLAEISGTHNFEVVASKVGIPNRFNHTAHFMLNDGHVKFQKVTNFHARQPLVQTATLWYNLQDQLITLQVAEGVNSERSLLKVTTSEYLAFDRQNVTIDISHSIPSLILIPEKLQLQFTGEMNLASGFYGNFTQVIDDDTTSSTAHVKYHQNGDTFTITSGLNIEQLASYGIITTFQNADHKILSLELTSMGESADAKFTFNPLEISTIWNNNFIDSNHEPSIAYWPNELMKKLPRQSKASLTLQRVDELSYDVNFDIENERQKLLRISASGSVVLQEAKKITLKLKIFEPFDNSSPVVANIDMSQSQASPMHLKLMLQNSDQDSTHFMVDCSSSETNQHTLYMELRNSNQEMKLFGLPDYATSSHTLTNDISEKSVTSSLAIRDGLTYTSSVQFANTENGNTLKFSLSHNKEDSIIPGRISVMNTMDLAKDSINHMLSYSINEASKTVKTTIYFLPIHSEKSTTLSVLVNLDHDVEELTQLFSVPSKSEVRYEFEIDYKLLDGRFWLADALPLLKYSFSVAADNEPLLHHAVKLYLGRSSTLTLDINENKLYGEFDMVNSDAQTLMLTWKQPDESKFVKLKRTKDPKGSNNFVLTQNFEADYSKISFDIYEDDSLAWPSTNQKFEVTINDDEPLSISMKFSKELGNSPFEAEFKSNILSELINYDLQSVKVTVTPVNDMLVSGLNSQLQLTGDKYDGLIKLTSMFSENLWKISVNHNIPMIVDYGIPQDTTLKFHKIETSNETEYDQQLCVEYQCVKVTYKKLNVDSKNIKHLVSMKADHNIKQIPIPDRVEFMVNLRYEYEPFYHHRRVFLPSQMSLNISSDSVDQFSVVANKTACLELHINHGYGEYLPLPQNVELVLFKTGRDEEIPKMESWFRVGMEKIYLKGSTDRFDTSQIDFSHNFKNLQVANEFVFNISSDWVEYKYDIFTVIDGEKKLMFIDVTNAKLNNATKRYELLFDIRHNMWHDGDWMDHSRVLIHWDNKNFPSIGGRNSTSGIEIQFHENLITWTNSQTVSKQDHASYYTRYTAVFITLPEFGNIIQHFRSEVTSNIDTNGEYYKWSNILTGNQYQANSSVTFDVGQNAYQFDANLRHNIKELSAYVPSNSNTEVVYAKKYSGLINFSINQVISEKTFLYNLNFNPQRKIILTTTVNHNYGSLEKSLMIPQEISMRLSYRKLREIGIKTTFGEKQTQSSIKFKRSSSGVGVYFTSAHDFEVVDQIYPKEIETSVKFHNFNNSQTLIGKWMSSHSRKAQQVTFICNTKSVMDGAFSIEQDVYLLKDYNIPLQYEITYSVDDWRNMEVSLRLDNDKITVYSKQNENKYMVGINNTLVQGNAIPKMLSVVVDYQLMENNKNIELAYLIDLEKWEANLSMLENARNELSLDLSHNNKKLLQTSTSYDVSEQVVVTFDMAQYFTTDIPRKISDTWSFSKAITGFEMNNDFILDSRTFSSSLIYLSETALQHAVTLKVSNTIDELVIVPEQAQIKYTLTMQENSMASNIVLEVENKNMMSIGVTASKTEGKNGQVFDFQLTSSQKMEGLSEIPRELFSTFQIVLNGYMVTSITATSIHDGNVVVKLDFENDDSMSGRIKFAENDFAFHDKLIRNQSRKTREYAISSQDRNVFVMQMNPDSYFDVDINTKDLGYFDDMGISTKLNNAENGLSYSTSFSYGRGNLALDIKQFKINFQSFQHWSYECQVEFSHSFENNFMNQMPNDLSLSVSGVLQNEEGQLHFVESKSVTSSEEIIFKHDVRVTSNDFKSSIYSEFSQSLVADVSQSHLVNIQSSHQLNPQDFKTTLNISANFDHENSVDLWAATTFTNGKFMSITGGKYNPEADFPLLFSGDDYSIFGKEILMKFGDKTKLSSLKLSLFSGDKNITLLFEEDPDATEYRARLLHDLDFVPIPANSTFTLAIESANAATVKFETMLEHGGYQYASLHGEEVPQRNKNKLTFDHSFDALEMSKIPRNTQLTWHNYNGESMVQVTRNEEEIILLQYDVTLDWDGIKVEFLVKQNIFVDVGLNSGYASVGFKRKHAVGIISISAGMNDQEQTELKVTIDQTNGLQFNSTVKFGQLSNYVIVKEIQCKIGAKTEDKKLTLVTDFKVDKESLLNISSTIIFMNEGYTSLKISSDHPIHFTIDGTLDKQLPNEVEATVTLDSNYLEHQKYLKVKADWQKDSVDARTLVLAKSTPNEDDDVVFSFSVLNLSRSSDESYEFNLIAKKLSSHVNSELLYKFEDSDLKKQFSVKLQHMLGDEVFAWKINSTSTPFQSNIILETPLTNEVNVNLTHSRSMKEIHVKLGGVATLSGHVKLVETEEEASLAIGCGIMNGMNGVTWAGQTLVSNKNNEVLCHMTTTDSFGLDSTLMLTSLSTNDNVLVVKYKTDEDLPNLIPRKLKETDQLIASYITNVIQNIKEFIQQCSNTDIDLTYLDKVDERMRSIVTCSSKVALRTLNIPSDVNVTIQAMKSYIDKTLQKLHSPIEDFRALYYESFLVNLKEDVNLAVAKYTRQDDESKLWWEVSHILPEIINHKIDQSEDYIYNAVKKNTPLSASFIEVMDKTIYIEIPLFSAITSSDAPTLTEKFKQIFGKFPFSENVNFLLNFKSTPLYNKVISYLKQDGGFLNFPGFASIMNGNMVTTFDGTVQNLQGSGCTHILAHDMRNDRFSLLMERDMNNDISYIYKTNVEIDQPMNVKISNELKVTINDALADLPRKVGDVMILRLPNAVHVIDRSADVELYCEVEESRNTICHIRVNSRYHGGVSGILGTMDGEKYNEIVNANGTIIRNSLIRDISSWSVTGSDDACLPLPAQSTTSEQANLCECDDLFKHSMSSIGACYNIVDPKPYLDSCRLNGCSIKKACNLVSSYRNRCEMMGIKTNKPDACSRCNEEPMTNRTFVEQEHNVVLVAASGCSHRIYRAAQKVLASFASDANANVRFGLVQLVDKSIIYRTFNGELFGNLNDLRQINGNHVAGFASSDDDSTKLDALKNANLYPFKNHAKKSIVMVVCDDNCESNPTSEAIQIGDVMEKLNIELHILGGSRLSVRKSGKKYRSITIGYNYEQFYSAKSLKTTKTFIPTKKLKIETEETSCRQLLKLTRSASYWNLNAITSRYSSISRSAVDLIGRHLKGDDASSYEAMTMCRYCKCSVLPNTFRTVCSPC